MLFVPSVREDIAKYYKNSFLKFKETGDLLFYLNYVDGQCIMGQVEDGRDFKLYLNEEEPYEVDYILPHKSFFQYGEHAALLQRIPARQYHRGITHENTGVFYMGGEKVRNMDLDFALLKAFVQKKKFYTLSEAVEAENVNSCALSPRMMYLKATRSICVDFTPVARVLTGKRINAHNKLFKQEIVDLLKANGETETFTFYEKAEKK